MPEARPKTRNVGNRLSSWNDDKFDVEVEVWMSLSAGTAFAPLLRVAILSNS